MTKDITPKSLGMLIDVIMPPHLAFGIPVYPSTRVHSHYVMSINRIRFASVYCLHVPTLHKVLLACLLTYLVTHSLTHSLTYSLTTYLLNIYSLTCSVFFL